MKGEGEAAGREKSWKGRELEGGESWGESWKFSEGREVKGGGAEKRHWGVEVVYLRVLIARRVQPHPQGVKLCCVLVYPFLSLAISPEAHMKNHIRILPS